MTLDEFVAKHGVPALPPGHFYRTTPGSRRWSPQPWPHYRRIHVRRKWRIGSRCLSWEFYGDAGRPLAGLREAGERAYADAFVRGSTDRVDYR